MPNLGFGVEQYPVTSKLHLEKKTRLLPGKYSLIFIFSLQLPILKNLYCTKSFGQSVTIILGHFNLKIDFSIFCQHRRVYQNSFEIFMICYFALFHWWWRISLIRYRYLSGFQWGSWLDIASQKHYTQIKKTCTV